MASAAKLGLGRLFLGLPMLAEQSDSALGRVNFDDSTDAWLNAWQQAHPGEQPVPPFVSYFVFVDESGDRARELARTYTARTFAAAITNYEMTSERYGAIQGEETSRARHLTPEQAQAAIDNAHRSAIAGTPQEVLEQLDEIRRVRNPQGMMPHLYTGGMPHEECVRSIRLFAEHCLDEMQSWEGAPATIEAA
jgi:alkanesulfonate monooxygenase SsuD/methylene tetrahydromethanopterin reductase-like flavin-dependent oxidoreductase (luciferase family)